MQRIYFITICSLFAACQNEQTGQVKPGLGNHAQVTTVEVVYPACRAFTAEVVVAGNAMPNQVVTLHAMEGGFVKNMLKEIGDAVQKGEVVAVLDNPELLHLRLRTEAALERAKADLLKAQAGLLKMRAMEKAARATSERLDAIFARTPSLTPAAEVEQARATTDAAQADTQIAMAQIEAAQREVAAFEAERDAVLLRLELLSVRAPFAGLLTRRYVDVGAAIQAGLSSSTPQPIAEIQQTNPIRLAIALPEADVAVVRAGTTVTVRFPELPGEPFEAKISRTAKAIDPVSGTMQVEIDLPNANGVIKPGMYAKVVLHIESRKGLLSLPATAQVIFRGEHFLLLAQDGKAVRVPLKKGLADKDFFEVLNTDINESSQVIVQGKSSVTVGQIVEPVLKK